MSKIKRLKIPALLLAVCLTLICAACETTPDVPDENPGMTPVESTDSKEAESYTAADAEGQATDNIGESERPGGAQDNVEGRPLPNTAGTSSEPRANEQAASPPAEPATSEPTPETEPADGQFPYAPFPFAFTTEDIYGNTVTEAVLGEKQLFFIHHWATWCDICAGGMPDLAATAQSYEERVGFIGLVDDYGGSLSAAKKIAESSGVPASFIMVDARDKGMKVILDLVQSGSFPTSVVISSDGEVFEPKLIGSLGERYAVLLDILLE